MLTMMVIMRLLFLFTYFSPTTTLLTISFVYWSLAPQLRYFFVLFSFGFKFPTFLLGIFVINNNDGLLLTWYWAIIMYIYIFHWLLTSTLLMMIMITIYTLSLIHTIAVTAAAVMMMTTTMMSMFFFFFCLNTMYLKNERNVKERYFVMI